MTFFINASLYSQTPIEKTNDGYSDWLFVNSDKLLQVRYKEVKREDDISYFEVQFKINFDDPAFCSNANCLGYLFVFSYPLLDNTENVETSYKFYNSYKKVYTLPYNMPMKMIFADGSKRHIRKEGFFYTLANDNTEMPASNLFLNCVDNMLSNNPNEHRCKPYYSNFKEAEAIIIR